MGWQCGRDKNYDSCLLLMSASTQFHNWKHCRLIRSCCSKLRLIVFFTAIVLKFYSTWLLTDKQLRAKYFSINHFSRHHPIITKTLYRVNVPHVLIKGEKNSRKYDLFCLKWIHYYGDPTRCQRDKKLCCGQNKLCVFRVDRRLYINHTLSNHVPRSNESAMVNLCRSAICT